MVKRAIQWCIDEVVVQQWRVAFIASQVIQQLKLLPLVAGETVEQKVALFQTTEDEVRLTLSLPLTSDLCWQVRRCLPDLLLASMSLLYSQHHSTR